MAGASESVAIRAHVVAAGIGKRMVLHDINLALRAGCWSAIVGPNGAGKSTLLRVLAGLLPCNGRIVLGGRVLADWPAQERARHLAWLGQAEGGGEDLLAWDIAMLGRLPHRPWLAAPSADDYAAVEQALQTARAWDLRGRRLGELSGGERQRVLLARMLATQADVLLMDEPLAHLDPPHQADWLATVRLLVSNGVTVISVLHELNMALQADEMLIICSGRLIHHGGCGNASTHRALEAAFDDRISVEPVRGSWIALPREANQGLPASAQAMS